MKSGIFMLTKSEQRVVILIVLALITAAFVRYWRDANSGQPSKVDQSLAPPTPFASPNDDQLSEEAIPSGDSDQREVPSPQSSP